MATQYAGIPELEESAAANERRRRIAEAMFAQSQEPITPFQQSGRMVVPMSWTQGLAQMLKAYYAGKGLKGAEKTDTELAGKYREGVTKAITDYEQRRAGLPEAPLTATRLTSERQPIPQTGKIEGIAPDPEGAARGALMNPFAPAGLQRVAQMDVVSNMRREDKEAERLFREEEAAKTRNASIEELQLRLQESRLTAQERNAILREIAMIRAQGSADAAAATRQAATTKEANKQQAALANTIDSMDRLAAEANRLLHHPGLPKTTGIRDWMPLVGGLATVPGTDAADFRAGLSTLKSQVGFSVLQAMRDASKSGGALGQISDRENILLQDNLAALDTAQSTDEFKKALSRIVQYTEEAKDRMRGAVDSADSASDKVVDFNELPP